MALSAGDRLGSYEIVAPLGAGGMGEVYRATDTKLKRQVAIKILPASLATDPDRLARFQREAEVLASLNHPNIAHIHGLEEGDGVKALVMELVEGPTLADRITQGAIPIEEALPIAKQIAEALEAAHEQSIIHRDLKPANIKVRPDGTVKVLDFGLAKAIEPVGSAPNMSQSPTITSPAMTQAGMILGTAAYMSPEQAKGRPADKRSDVWAFGCVLYEMLAGRRAFNGEDVAETLAHILTKEPDWSALPAGTSVAMRRLLRRCLERDRRRRLDSAADARLEIEEAAKEETLPPPSPWSAPAVQHARLPWVATALATLAAAAAAVAWAPWRTAPEPARLAFELQMDTPGSINTSLSMFAISPDGMQVVAVVQDGNVPRLSVRTLARLEAVTLTRTDGASYPFWSPNGRTVGFFADGKLRTVDLAGGSPQVLADAPMAYGGAWNRDGLILFAPQQTGPIYSVAASGSGSAIPITELDATRGDTSHRFPRFLPDGVHFLYLVRGSSPGSGGTYVGSLASKETHRLVDALNKADFAPPDLLLFARESTLMGQRLDTGSFQLIGAPFRVVEPMYSSMVSGAAAFSVSDNGVLTFRIGVGGDVRDLVWVDRSGKREGTVGAPAGYQNPRLSPNGRQLAVFRPEGGGDVWTTELERGNSSRFSRLTLDPASDNVPLWSPNGTHIAYVSNRDGGVFNIYRKSVGGTGPEEPLLKTPRDKLLNDWSPDGSYLVYQEDDPQTKTDLWMLPLVGDRKPLQLLATPFNESLATLSPNGDWMAYTSDESGTRQVYVQRFPISERKWPVSSGRTAATHARWGSEEELFFDNVGTMMAVSVTGLGSAGEPRIGTPKPLFVGLMALPPHNFDVADAGRRFLALLASGSVTPAGGVPPITVVVNWKSGLSLGR